MVDVFQLQGDDFQKEVHQEYKLGKVLLYTAQEKKTPEKNQAFLMTVSNQLLLIRSILTQLEVLDSFGDQHKSSAKKKN